GLRDEWGTDRGWCHRLLLHPTQAEPGWGTRLFGLPEAEQRHRDPEAEHDVRQQDAREEEDAGAGEQDQPCIQSGADGTEYAASEYLNRERQREHEERHWNARGDGQCSCGGVS